MNKTISMPVDVATVKTPWQAWMMLPARTLLFAAFQAIFALVYFLGGSAHAWDDSSAWWPFSVTLTNVVCILLLIPLFRSEGKSYLNLFRIDREHIKNDLVAVLVVLVITIPVAMLPDILLANWLFGDIKVAMGLFIHHLPAWATLSGFILFPVTQGMAELVTYFLYIEPHLEDQLKVRWLALSIAAIALGIQHIAVPLLFNAPFIIWRALMFIPFAFLLGITLRWRPRLLIYLAIIHMLMDMGTAAMLFTV
ncbi:MAG TPA: hypothetical protein VMS73_10355 [Anaerolineaceae bacterium]|nr:hypothetical protein [Anaerolineaceae bacterium]